jgi:HK97 family phage prohead protease
MQIGERAYSSFNPDVRQTSDGKRTVINISTDSVDRHGTIIDARGVSLDAFKRNPVVLFNHDYSQVVGRASNIQTRGNHIVAEIEWDEADPFAAQIARKMRDGFLNAASVGFLVEDGEDDAERGAYRITRSELVEFSIVAVPSNRDALVVSRSLQQQVEDMRAELEALRRTAETSATARQAPEDTADEAADAADAAASPDPEPEAADEAPEPEQAPAPHQPARMATAQEYAALARAMQPVILDSVYRALGKR